MFRGTMSVPRCVGAVNETRRRSTSCITSMTVERVAAECTMHAANHSRSLAVSPFGLSDTTFCPFFNKIIRRRILNLLWDKHSINRKCEFFLTCVYLMNSLSMTPLLYLIKII